MRGMIGAFYLMLSEFLIEDLMESAANCSSLFSKITCWSWCYSWTSSWMQPVDLFMGIWGYNIRNIIINKMSFDKFLNLSSDGFMIQMKEYPYFFDIPQK